MVNTAKITYTSTVRRLVLPGSNVNQSPELPENYLTEEDSENYLTEEDTANVLTEE
jgi:hypothetical protein